MGTPASSQRVKKLCSLLKNDFKLVKRWFFFSRTSNLVFLFLFCALVALRFLLKTKVTISEQAHYYFFSSVAQSMAAIIALAGTVGVFSYSHIFEKLTRLKQITREKFQSPNWVGFVGESDSLSWRDNEVINNAKAYDAANAPPHIRNVLPGLIREMESLQKPLDVYITNALPSLVSSSFSFIVSLIFLPLSVWLAKTKLGLFFITLILFFVIISLSNIYRFFKSILIK